MNAPAFSAADTDAEAEHIAAIVALIDAWTKTQITDAYSAGLITERDGDRLIRENGLIYA